MRRQQLGSTQPGAPTGVIVASNRLCWNLLPLQTLIWAHFITVYFHKVTKPQSTDLFRDSPSSFTAPSRGVGISPDGLSDLDHLGLLYV